MSFASVIFTNQGINLQAKAEAGAQLNFTRIGIGDGELGEQSIPTLTNLINWVRDIEITTLKALGGGYASVGGQVTNQGLETGFYWREVGLFATDPDLGEILYCYGNAGALAEYIPAEGVEILSRYFNILPIIGNAENVTAIINESLVYVTYPEFEDHINNTTTMHGATSAATANKLIIRDASGRAKIAAPSASDDIARKQEVDDAIAAAQANLNSLAMMISMGAMI